jgi:hypothetical protein
MARTRSALLILFAAAISSCFLFLSTSAQAEEAIPVPTIAFASAGDGHVWLAYALTGEAEHASECRLQVFRTTAEGSYPEQPIGEVEAGPGCPGRNAFIDASAANGMTYYYRVRAILSGNASAFSNEVSATPAASGEKPSAPTSLAVTNGGTCAILTWNAPVSNGSSPVTEFEVLLASSPSISSAEHVLTVPWNSRGANVCVDRFGMDTFIFICAKNPFGTGAFAGPAMVNVSVGGEAPSAPRSLVAEGGDLEIFLSWDHPASQGSSAVMEYLVFRRVGNTPWGEIASVPAGANEYLDTLLAFPLTYEYRVVAVSLSGVSAPSPSVLCRSGAHTPPGPPANVTAVQASPYSVLVSWSPPLDDGGAIVLNYHLMRGLAGGNWEMQTIVGNVTCYLDPEVAPGVQYRYRVAAYTRFAHIWDMAWADAYAEVHGVGQIPSAPEHLRASNAADGIVSISWAHPADPSYSGILRYELARSFSPTSWADAEVFDCGVTAFDDSVGHGSAYYRVRCIGAQGAGPWSDVASVLVGAPPPALSRIKAFPGNGEAMVVWTLPMGFLDQAEQFTFRVYRCSGPDGGEVCLGEVGPFGSVIGVYREGGLTNGIHYSYSVAAVRWGMDGERTAAASATPSATGPTPEAPAIIASPTRWRTAILLGTSEDLLERGVSGYEIWIGNPGGDMVLWDAYFPDVWPATGPVIYELSLERTTPERLNALWQLGVLQGDARLVGAYWAKAIGLYGTGPISLPSIAFDGAGYGEAPDGMAYWANGTTEGIRLGYGAPAYPGTTNYLTAYVWRNDHNSIFSPFHFTLLGYIITRSTEGGQFIDRTAEVGVTYYYYLVFVSGAGGLESDLLQATSRNGCPEQPAGPSASCSGSTITLRWQHPPQGASATGYLVFRGSGGADFVRVAELGASSTLFQDANLTAGSYRYYVVALGTAGESLPSAVVTADVKALPQEPNGSTVVLLAIGAAAAAFVALATLRRMRR